MTRRLALVLLAAAAVLLSTGSAGFSAVEADRGMDARVVEDENAYLGIEVVETEGFVGGDSFTVLRLTDRFASDVDLAGLAASSPVATVHTAAPADIGGPSDPLEVRASCTDAGDDDVRFDVRAEGPDVQVTAERAVPVRCEEPEIQSVDFDGCGNAHVEADEPIYPLTVRKRIANPSTGETTTETVTINSDGQVGGSPGGKLVAVELDSSFDLDKTTYNNPNTCVDAGPDGTPQQGPGNQPTEPGNQPTEPGNGQSVRIP